MCLRRHSYAWQSSIICVVWKTLLFYVEVYGTSGAKVLARNFEDDASRAIGFVGMLKTRFWSNTFTYTGQIVSDRNPYRYMPVIAFAGNWHTEDLETRIGLDKNEHDAHSNSWDRISNRKEWIKQQLVSWRIHVAKLLFSDFVEKRVQWNPTDSRVVNM